MAETRTIVVNGKTHTLEEQRHGDQVEVTQRDETGHVVAWYWRKVAPDATVPMVASPSHTIRIAGVPPSSNDQLKGQP